MPNVLPFLDQRADALLINLGTFDAERRKASLAAVATANKRRIPWVLDPVFIDRSASRASRDDVADRWAESRAVPATEGAGAGITAELLTKAGLDVVLIEEGPLRTSSDFNQKESEAYATLYQEGAGRRTMDGALTLLQGRCVGGTTVINWTSSFRTPASTLKYWEDNFGLKGFGEGFDKLP